MRVDNSRGITIARDYRRKEPSLRDETPSTGTSLVTVEPTAPADSRRFRTSRTLATFVTQLIAREQNAPHLRVRCRTEPSEGAQSYRKMLDIGGVPNRYTSGYLALPF
jgi:hypothetical protein